jgi:hypothetical protein
MSYLVFCTFDLKAASGQDYQAAYADLAGIGLAKVHQGSNGGQAVIPTTSAMGTFTGANAKSVCEFVRDRVKNAFAARRFKSEVFVTCGGDWAWTVGST